FSAGNKDFNDNTLQELNAKGTDYTYATVSGSSTEAALVSWFGRAAYTYDDRYMFEATFRYDGSSKLSAKNRWHLFPSVSAAWNINKEKWFGIRDVDVLKIRTSYGIMGSESVSNYAYYMTAGPYSQNYSFGGTPATGYGVSTLTDTGLGWEKTASFDAGLDLMMWKGKMSFEIDAFHKRTYDILMTRSIPSHLGGLSGPTSNVGTVQNRGFDTSLSWRDGIGNNFHYGIYGSFTFVRNKVLFLDGGTILQNNNTLITKENYPIRSFYVLEADGFYDSYEEINSAEAVYGDRSALRPGYVKYVDQNGDGVIDNNDKIITRNSIPEITYSFGFNIGWKSLSLEAQFQGIGDCYIYLTGNLATPFNNGAGVTKEWATDSWTYATKNEATLPILTTYTDAPMNFQPSTLWLRNCKYLRLKNIQLSYNVPTSLLKWIKMSSMQMYVSCQNLLTFTDFNIWDPEITSTNTDLRYDYPNLKSYSVGINITF
ncbi:MAG: SusC/RagA family TonB-linked outer membrane protein, partial [Bacteroidales bacterium]|nr:SusC/RagA family TonB-linked outer membrane protein [Bacteroidales bacterium]